MKTRLDSRGLFEAVETIRTYRKESARSVADALDISPATFTRLKAGKAISVTAYLSICSYLGRETPYSQPVHERRKGGK